MRRIHIAIASWLACVLLSPTLYMAAMPCCRQEQKSPAGGAHHCHGMASEPVPGATLRSGHGCPSLPCCCTGAAAWSLLAAGAEAPAPIAPPALPVASAPDPILLDDACLRAASVRGPPSLLTS